MSAIYFEVHSKIRLVLDGKMLDGESNVDGRI